MVRAQSATHLILKDVWICGPPSRALCESCSDSRRSLHAPQGKSRWKLLIAIWWFAQEKQYLLFTGPRILLWDAGVIGEETRVPCRRSVETSHKQMRTFNSFFFIPMIILINLNKLGDINVSILILWFSSWLLTDQHHQNYNTFKFFIYRKTLLCKKNISTKNFFFFLKEKLLKHIISNPGDSNSHLHLNAGMRVVVTDFKVFCTEIINILHISQDFQLGEGTNLPLKLQI